MSPFHVESLRCGDSDVLCGPLSLLVVCQSLSVDADLEELRDLSGFDEKKDARAEEGGGGKGSVRGGDEDRN